MRLLFPYTLVVFAFFFIYIKGLAQENPPIQSYSPNLYNAGTQNWKITQDNNRNVYFANNDGLLQYNGNQWRLYPTPNASILRSVYAMDNIIYSGSYMDFGFWKPSPTGALEYNSLVDDLSFEMFEDEQVWSINHYNQFVIFQTLDRLIIFDQLDFQLDSITPTKKILRSFVQNGSIFFQQIDGAIYQILNGEASLIIPSAFMSDKAVIQIFNNENQISFVTERNGFFKWDNNKLTPILTNTLENLNGKSIYSSIQTTDGDYVLGSVSHGLYIFSNEGKFKNQFNKNNGLSNNTVLSTHVDFDGNLWAGLDNGISYINLDSAFSVELDYEGTLGTVYDTVLYEGGLYLGTNQGLFYKKYPSNDDFSLVSSLDGQVWNLTIIDNQLFCGHNRGPFLIEKNTATPLGSFMGAWNFKPLNKKTLLVGSYDGIHVFLKSQNRWIYSHRINGFEISSRFLEVTNSEQLLVSHEYKGVFLIKLNNTYTEAEEIKMMNNLENSLYSSLTSLKQNIYFLSKNGFYIYKPEEEDFTLINEISELVTSSNFISGKLVNHNNSKIWFFEKENIVRLELNSLSSSFLVTKFPISYSLRATARGFENISLVSPNQYLLGTSSGYIIFDTEHQKTKQSPIVINKISTQNNDGQKIEMPLNEPLIFSSKFNNINIQFNIPRFENNNDFEFQYFLEGYNKDWSEWTNESSATFGNLSYGNYEFKIREKSLGVVNPSMTTLKFEVSKPWYISNLMLTFYLVCLLGFSFFINNSYLNYYKKQKARLVAINQKKIDLVNLKNKEQIMRLKNESLQENIENKNRELAIATMASIKRNQFLIRIIDDLENAKNEGSVFQVIQTIKRNLKNNDDWEFFEQAFNNSDKDFLKTVKAKNPNLTNNDLKLCAYLRLNLSSKEIAPLLNISTRSVEIKRYRLRKKINLKQGQNLTDYIISL